MILDVLSSFSDPCTCADDNLFMFQGVLQKESMTILQATATGERVERPIPVARASEVYHAFHAIEMQPSDVGTATVTNPGHSTSIIITCVKSGC